MRRLISTTIAITLVAATPAAADWSFTRWGMTPAQVVRASSGTARLQNVPPNPGQTHIIKAVGSTRSGDLNFHADYRFLNDRLTSVTLYLRSGGTCITVMGALEDKYGPRTRGILGTYEWSSARENVRVELDMRGCSVSYRPMRGANSSGL